MYMSINDNYNKISIAVDKYGFSAGIFIDLSKAFDALNNVILLKKLNHFDIRGIAPDWFKSYLNSGKQCVTLNCVKSSLRLIAHGVPQGSILGPLLCILHIGDIVNCSDLILFMLLSDDTNLFYSREDISTLKNVVNPELVNVSNLVINCH
jgi:hypothetical protein